MHRNRPPANYDRAAELFVREKLAQIFAATPSPMNRHRSFTRARREAGLYPLTHSASILGPETEASHSRCFKIVCKGLFRPAQYSAHRDLGPNIEPVGLLPRSLETATRHR